MRAPPWLLFPLALAAMGLAAALSSCEGGGKPAAADDRIATISRGVEVDLAPHVSGPGRTVVEFTADW